MKKEWKIRFDRAVKDFIDWSSFYRYFQFIRITLIVLMLDHTAHYFISAWKLFSPDENTIDWAFEQNAKALYYAHHLMHGQIVDTHS